MFMMTTAQRAHYRVQKAKTVKFLETGEGQPQYQSLAELDDTFIGQPQGQVVHDHHQHTLLSPQFNQLGLEDSWTFSTWTITEVPTQNFN